MAQGTRRKQSCNESMEKVKAVRLSSHATILKSDRRNYQSKYSKRHPIREIIRSRGDHSCAQQPVSVSATPVVVSDGLVE